MLPPARLRSAVRRHRRGLAAVAAAGAMLAAISALRPGASSAVAADVAAAPTSLRSGEVAVPVTLAAPAIAATVEVGDIVDVVVVPDDPTADAVVVAPAARVLRAATSGGFGTGASAVLLVGVPETDGIRLSAVVGRTLTIVIRSG